jgi:hypothetical protein
MYLGRNKVRRTWKDNLGSRQDGLLSGIDDVKAT